MIIFNLSLIFHVMYLILGFKKFNVNKQNKTLINCSKKGVCVTHPMSPLFVFVRRPRKMVFLTALKDSLVFNIRLILTTK